MIRFGGDYNVGHMSMPVLNGVDFEFYIDFLRTLVWALAGSNQAD